MIFWPDWLKQAFRNLTAYVEPYRMVRDVKGSAHCLFGGSCTVSVTRDFPQPSRPAVWLTKLSTQWVPSLFPMGK